MPYSREYFQSLVENISHIISVVTPGGIIQYESPSVYREPGYPPP